MAAGGGVATTIAVVAALAAAALFGVSTVLQQAAARAEPAAPGAHVLRWRLLGRLARRPRWLIAVGLAAVSYGVQALALAFGPLVLVQPLAAMDLLFALPLLARRNRRRLRRDEWLGSALVVTGVGLFLALSRPGEGRTAPPLADWIPVLAAIGSVVFVATALASRMSAGTRTALLASAGASVFALVDALSKSLVGQLRDDGLVTLMRWEPYALLAAGLTGLLLAQTAFRSGSLLISLPIIDTLEPIGAVLVGALVFDEHVARSLPLLVGQLLAAAVAVAGIVVLDRSPLTTSMRG